MKEYLVMGVHAMERCLQRKVDPERVRRQCQALPDFTTDFKWTFPNGLTAVLIRHRKGFPMLATVYWAHARPRKRMKR